MPRIVIVGAGISGLALAFRLRQRQPDAEITVLESASRPGGKIRTEHERGFILEAGPNGFLETKPSTLQLSRDLGLASELVAASEESRRHRYLFVNHRLRELPSGPLGLLTTRALGWRGKFGLMTECFRGGKAPEKDESVGEFFRRRMGQHAADVLGDALATGIHGGDPELLSLKAAFPRAAELEAKHGSVVRGFLRSAKKRRQDAKSRGEPPPQTGRMWSFRAGLGRMIETLAQQLSPICGVAVTRIERTETGWRVHGDGKDVWQADSVVLACPADRQAEILAEFDAELAAELVGIAYNRIAVVGVGFRQSDVAGVPPGFGYIAPQRTRRDLLGVQWCSAIYPGRAPAGCVLWRALCGGWHRPEVVDWDDAKLLAAVRAELKLALGVAAEPIFQRIIRWDRAIPQYHVGHLQRLARIEQRAGRHYGLILTGNAYRGVSLNDCTEQAELLAERIEVNAKGIVP